MNDRHPRGVARRAMLGGLLALPAHAAGWRPSGPQRLVVAAAPGGTLDIHARACQPLLSARLGQPVLVENQGGAAGKVAAQMVARAAPDGTTLLVTSGDGLVLRDILMGARDGRMRGLLRPVLLTISAAQLLVTHPRSGFADLAGFVAAARARDGALSLGVPGIGGIAHVISEMVNRPLGITVTHVPYRGGGPATLDLLAGQIDAMIITLPAVTDTVREGRLVPLAVSTRARDPALPAVPSYHEFGVTGFDVPSTQGVLAPAATPEPVIAACAEAWRAALGEPEVRGRLERLGFRVEAKSGAAFGAILDDAERRFAEAIAAAGIRAE